MSHSIQNSVFKNFFDYFQPFFTYWPYEVANDKLFNIFAFTLHNVCSKTPSVYPGYLHGSIGARLGSFHSIFHKHHTQSHGDNLQIEHCPRSSLFLHRKQSLSEPVTHSRCTWLELSRYHRQHFYFQSPARPTGKGWVLYFLAISPPRRRRRRLG